MTDAAPCDRPLGREPAGMCLVLMARASALGKLPTGELWECLTYVWEN